jgi:DNA-binding protein Fis
MAQNCKYYITDKNGKGKFVDEFTFKQILNDGLLDLMLSQDAFSIPEIDSEDIINDDFLEKVAPVEIEKGPIKLRILRKIAHSKNINNQKVVDDTGEVVGPNQKNPLKVIEEANKQIKAENARLKTNRPELKLQLVIPMPGGVFKTGGISDEILKEMRGEYRKVLADPKNVGKVFMLVPSAYGLYPMQMFTNKMKDTKIWKEFKKIGFELLESDNLDTLKEKKSAIEKLIYRTTFDKEGDVLTVSTENADGTTTKTEFNVTEKGVKQKYEEFIGNLLARVDYGNINSTEVKDWNKYYADKGFITTDLFTEGGNFFHSSSFVVETFIAKHKDKEILDEALNAQGVGDNIENAIVEDAINSTTQTKSTKDPQKRNEDPLNGVSPSDLKRAELLYINPKAGNINHRVKVEAEILDGKLRIVKMTLGSMKKVEGKPVFTAEEELDIRAREQQFVIQEYFKKPVVTRVVAQLNSIKTEEELGAEKEVSIEDAEKAVPKDIDDLTEEQMARAADTVPLEDIFPTEPDPDPNFVDPDALGTNEDEGGYRGEAFEDDELNFDPDTDTPFRMIEEGQEGTPWNQEQKEKELKFLQRKISGHLVGKGSRLNMFETIEELEEHLPKEVYEQILEARKNGKALFGLFTKAAIFLGENAFEGTGYHEAFHIVFRLALTQKQRIQLLNEAMDNYSDALEAMYGKKVDELTFLEVEEFLADKFMEYVQAEEANASTLKGRIKSFFKALFRNIRMFFSPRSRVRIDDLFSDINLGIYRNRPKFEDTDTTKIDPESVRFRTFEDPRLELEGLRYMEYTFFNILNDFAQSKKEYLEKSPQELINIMGVRKIYSQLLYRIRQDYRANAKRASQSVKSKEVAEQLLNLYKELTDNMSSEVLTDITYKFPVRKDGGFVEKEVSYPAFVKTTPLLERFNATLGMHQIKMKLASVSYLKVSKEEKTTLDEDFEEGTTEERWQRAVVEIDPRTTLTGKVRKVLATIPKTYINSKGDERVSRNRFGAPEVYSSNEVFSYLAQHITDSYDYGIMIDTLENLRHKKPFIAYILDEHIYKDSNFGKQLFINLGQKTNKNFTTIVQDNEGQFLTFYSNRAGIKEIIQDTIINSVNNLRSPLFKKFQEGVRKGQKNYEDIDLEYVKKLRKKLENTVLRYTHGTIKNDKGERNAPEVHTSPSKVKAEFLPAISAIFKDIGINISPEQIQDIWAPPRDDSKTVTGWNNLVDVADVLHQLVAEFESKKNPFLSHKPAEQIVNSQYVGEKSLISTLAGVLKPGLEKETILAFRNADNKSAYAIQMANYLSKKIAKLTTVEGINELRNEFKHDKLMSQLPIWDELIESEVDEEGNFIGGTLKSLTQHLEVTIFDGYRREGKLKSVSYSKSSEIERMAISLGLFHNNGSDKIGIFRMGTPSDSTTLPLLKFNKHSNEALVEKLSKLAVAEYTRILKVLNIDEDSELARVPNYVERGSEFQILSFLNDKIDLSKPVDFKGEDFKEIIENFLNNEFRDIHIKYYKKVGIITKVDKNGKLTFAENIFPKQHRGKDEEAFFWNYVNNQFYLYTQTNTLFGGDPAFYKNSGDYQKRFKQIISPVQYGDTSPLGGKTYKGYIFQDELEKSEQAVIDNNIKLIKESKNLTPTKKKELIAFWDSKQHNITDGATFISIDRAMDQLEMLDRLTPEHIAAAKRIKDGKETIDDINLFQVQKPFYYGQKIIDGTVVPFQMKNSEAILTKSMAYTKENGKFKYPKLKTAYDLMHPEKGVGIDFIAFESAVKVGAIANAFDAQGRPLYTTISEDGTLSDNPTLVELSHENYGHQQETPAHYVDDVSNYGSQLRVLSIADMDWEAEYEPGINGKDLAHEYQQLVVQNLKESFEGVKKFFLDAEGNLNYPKLLEIVKREMLDRGLGPSFIEAIEPIVEVIGGVETQSDKPTLPLWHPKISYKVESLLTALFNNNVLKQKINGGNLVNATSYGVSDTLKYHNEGGRIYMEALLPAWSMKYFPLTKDNQIDWDAINKSPDAKKILEVLGYRIPTEDKYSMFSIKVVGFTPPAAGGLIILPKEATTQAGLDFDIDKLFMMLKNMYVDANGNVRIVKYHTRNEAEKLAANIYRSHRSLEKFVHEHYDEKKAEQILEARRAIIDSNYENRLAKKEIFESDKHKDLYTKIQEMKLNRKFEQNEQRQAVLSLSIDNLYKQLEEDFVPYDEAIGHNNKQTEALITEIAHTLKKIDFDPVQYNSKEARDNRIIEILTSIMRHPHTAESLVDVGNFDQLQEIADKTVLLQNKSTKTKAKKLIEKHRKGDIDVFSYRKQLADLREKLESVDNNINYPSIQDEFSARNMVGLGLIGVFANHNTHHAKAQYTKLELANPIVFKISGTKVSFDNLHNVYSEVTGERISKSGANKLAAVVDNAKQPISADINVNMYTAKLAAMFGRLGIPEDLTFAFLNQPIILEFVQEYHRKKGSLSDQVLIVDELTSKWLTQIQNKLDFNEVQMKKFLKDSGNFTDLDLELLESNLDPSLESRKYYLTQIKALNMFTYSMGIAEELELLVQASRVDATSKGVGPSFAESYSFINLQEKVRTRPISNLIGIEDFFVNNGEQLMNPAFARHALWGPTSIFNEIFPSVGTINDRGDIDYSTLGKIKNMFSFMKDNHLAITDKEARQIDNHFKTFIGSGLPFFGYPKAEDTLINTPELLKQYKLNNPDSKYIEFLDQLHVKNPDKRADFPRIQYYNTGKQALDHERMERLWEAMLQDTDPETKKLAIELVRYTYFSNGYNFGTFSFFNLIPNLFWTDSFARENVSLGLTKKDMSFNQLLENYLDKIREEGLSGTVAKRFMRQFAQNTASKSFMIKKVDFTNREYGLIKDKPKDVNNVQVVTKGDNPILVESDSGVKTFNIRPIALENDLTILFELAREHEDKKFFLPKRLYNDQPGQKKGAQFKKMINVLKKLEGEIGIPENIIFPNKKLDPRDFKKAAVDGDKIRLFKKAHKHLMIPSNREVITTDKDGVVHKKRLMQPAPFVKIVGKKRTVLFELVPAESENSELVYKVIPNLGTTNFAMEYNLYENIDESVVPKVVKYFNEKKAEENVDKMADAAAEALFGEDGPAGQLDKMADAAMSQVHGPAAEDVTDLENIEQKTEKKDDPLDLGDPEEMLKKVGNLDPDINDKIVDEASENIVKELTVEQQVTRQYNSYLKAFTVAVRENRVAESDLISLQEWMESSPAIRENAIECL